MCAWWWGCCDRPSPGTLTRADLSRSAGEVYGGVCTPLPRCGRGRAVLTARVRVPRALVIGGRRGIGAAVVQTLTARGMDVTYTYRTFQADSPATAVPLDLADRSAVETFAEH